MPDFISTHDKDALSIEFKKLNEPSRGIFVSTLRTGLKVVKPLVKVELDAVDRNLAKWQKDKALQRAVYKWLDPSRAAFAGGSIDGFKEAVGLAKLPTTSFCERLRHFGERMKDQAPKLRRYIDARLADIEYLERSDHVRTNTLTFFELYQRAVVDAALQVAGGASGFETQANAVLKSILPAVAGVFREILDPDLKSDNVYTNANFMAVVKLPQETRVGDVPKFVGSYAETPAAKRAADLWRDLDDRIDRVFVVVADSDDNRRVGFWVPDVVDEAGYIPGAPTAYNRKIPYAVFTDDPPPLKVGNRRTRNEWEEYLLDRSEDGFKDDMFISIPVMGRAKHDTDPVVAGVANVNCGAGRYWPRAYSDAWLALAAELASPFLALAWHSFLIQHVAATGRTDLLRANPFVYSLPVRTASGDGDLNDKQKFGN